jgi:hypothetical protein
VNSIIGAIRCPTLGELLTATLDLAEELTGSRAGVFHFVENDQSTLWLQAWSTNTVARMCTAEGTGSHYPIGQAGVWADCVRVGKPGQRRCGTGAAGSSARCRWSGT